MDIEHKNRGIVAYDVHPSDLRDYSWCKYHIEKGIKIYYNAEDWEPVDEWITIQVNKKGWESQIEDKVKHLIHKDSSHYDPGFFISYKWGV